MKTTPSRRPSASANRGPVIRIRIRKPRAWPLTVRLYPIKILPLGILTRRPRDLEPLCGSDQGTVVEIPCMSNDDIFPCPSFVNGLTGERLVDLIQVTTISLDYCEIKGAETRIPSSDKNEIEVLFHHGGENIWVYVPYDYVKDRDDFK